MSRTSAKRKAKAASVAAELLPDGGRVLEVSCGMGRALEQLKGRGFEVVGTNYTKYEGESSEVDIRHGVDLLQGLPFEDGSFDAVLLLDVIEHLHDHERALSELARVCRRGGILIIVTPNILRLASRLHFLFTGFFKVKRPFIGFDVPLESAFGFHNYPVHLPVLLYQISSRGFSLVRFSASTYKIKSFLLYALAWPVVTIATWLKVQHSEKYLKNRDSAGVIQRCLTSVPGLCGEFVILAARKRGNMAEEGGALQTRLPKWSRKWREETSPPGKDG